MDKKRIAVFDADSDDCSTVAKTIGEHFNKNGQPADLFEFSDTQHFVRSVLKNNYDMAFIGVESMMDVETARMARNVDKRCAFFLVSSVDDYSLEGFRLHALDYLMRPISAERVNEAVRRMDMDCLKGARGVDYG